MRFSISSPPLILAFTMFCCATGATGTQAHEIPGDVKVQAFIRPSGQNLSLAVRVPLEAMRDIEFPTRGPGYLNIAESGRDLREAAMLWVADDISLYEGDVRLEPANLAAVRVSLPTDAAFASYETARSHILGAALPADTELVWQQAMLDVLFEYPITAEDSAFSIEPQLARLGIRTTTVLRFLPPGGSERVFQYLGDPGLVHLDPRWHQAALRFLGLGCEHILVGADHLLFLFCLVLPFRRVRDLVVLVTSFTVAHSITLIAAGLDLIAGAQWFPPLIETLIALSIVYMALENILGANLQRRWLVTFGFGLVHGFGFAFLMQESLQFAGAHLLTSLLAFNIGIELGQLLILAVVVPFFWLLFRYLPAERVTIIVFSALIAHSAWHWLTERFTRLTAYSFQLPALDTLLLVNVMRWLMLVIVLGGTLWFLYRFVDSWLTRDRP